MNARCCSSKSAFRLSCKLELTAPRTVMNVVVLHFCRKTARALPQAVVCTSCGHMLSERLVRFCLNVECPPSVACFSANRLKHSELQVKEIKSPFD